MPKEVSDRVKELIKERKSAKEAMKQAWDEYKAKTEKALEEKDTEIKNKTEELGKKDQEIADLKNPKVEEKKEPEMTVGTVEIKDNYKSIQQEVNDKAFKKR
jgi:Mg2+/Co2+ transporter CorB